MSQIMYQLHPCEEWKRFKISPLPGFKYNPDGSLVYEQYTRPGSERQALRDFPILPDKASFTVPAGIFNDVLTSLDLHRRRLVVS